MEIDLLQPLLLTLEENFQYYFHDIIEKFDSIGAKEWIEANSTKTSMQEFANNLNLVDGTVNYEFWVPIVVVWNNLKPPSAIDAENINSVIITKTTSLRCLTALANAVSNLLGVVALVEINKSAVLRYLKSHLPSICFRGDNFSVNFVDCLDDNITKLRSTINQSKLSENAITNKNKNAMIEEIFGTKNPSISEMKKLKSDKMVNLAKYLDLNLPTQKTFGVFKDHGMMWRQRLISHIVHSLLVSGSTKNY